MEEIYFDNAATTRTDPEVAALMTHVLCEEYGNPSSLHSRGVQAQLLIERASRQLAAALGMKRGKGRILFTSGGTEANNLALFGAAEDFPGRDLRRLRLGELFREEYAVFQRAPPSGTYKAG